MSTKICRERRTARAVVHALAVGSACGSNPDPVDLTAPPCERAWGDKLGVPFVRICPSDLPGGVTEPFWIAVAPVGCSGGEHETIECPPIVPLGMPERGPIAARRVQMIAAELAHRTCTLRFGGRLPTAAERAQAVAGLGIAAVLVTDGDSNRRLDEVPEWTTAERCETPSTTTGCAMTRVPSMPPVIPWPQVRTCRATPAEPTGALVIGPGESCPITPPPGVPPCLISARGARSFALGCDPVRDEVHPPAREDRAAFRCVVPAGAIAGTIKR